MHIYTVVVAIVILLAIIISISIYEVRHFTINRIVLPGSVNLRFTLISDLHSEVYGHNNDEIIDAINVERPDIIIIAGDMIMGKKKPKYDVAIDLISRLSRKYKVYYGLGNHESRLMRRNDLYGNVYEDYMNKLLNSANSDNLYILDNDIADISSDVSICGITIEEKLYSKKKVTVSSNYFQGYAARMNPEKYNIVIAHNPEYAENYKVLNADLILSGHVHGGTVRIPYVGGLISTRFTPFPKYTKGLYKLNERTNMIVSAGLGTHTIKLRLFNRPELVFVNVTKSS